MRILRSRASCDTVSLSPASSPVSSCSQSSSSSSAGLGQCQICSNQDSNGELIICSLCANQFHAIKCLKIRRQTLAKLDQDNWQCLNCKSCEICGRRQRTLRSIPDNSLVICQSCDRGFHRHCLIGESGDLRKWNCYECSDNGQFSKSKSDEEVEDEEEDEDDDDEEEEEENCDDNEDGDEEVGANADDEIDEGADVPSDSDHSSVASPEPRLLRSRSAPRPPVRRSGRSCVKEPEVQNHQETSEPENGLSSPEKPPSLSPSTRGGKLRGRPPKRRLSFASPPRNDSSARKAREDTKIRELDEREDALGEIHCRVAGCDSRGHLSGKFPTHYTTTACPVFHNLTWKECEERYQRRCKRREGGESSVELTPTKAQKKSPHKEDKLSVLSETRKREMSNIGNTPKKDGPRSRSITAREPDLKNLTPIFDYDMFREAQARAAELIQEQVKNSVTKKSGVKSIEMGKYEMQVWYSSPYPPEYIVLPKLWICEFCLKYFNSPLIMKRHVVKCPLRCPPGNEIYRQGSISVFEVDGEKNKFYCQNLCLLAKLFLDHKTLYYDVEPFKFYIMTESDRDGFHIIGYFSKEKNSFLNYNVSCILSLPPYQKQGFGRMLIDFSYLLTKAEGKVGSPEKPLSDLGLISYRSYWKNVILDYLCKYQGSEISIKDLSHETAINAYDIVSTLQALGMLKYWKGKHLVLTRKDVLDEHKQKCKKRKNTKTIDPNCLVWDPPGKEPVKDEKK